jgi:Flp pilus assembly protein TadG
MAGVTRCESGGVAVLFGLAAPVLGLAVAGAIEYVTLTARQSAMQKAADAAAIAAAQQLRLSNASDTIVLAVARSIVDTSLPRKTDVASRTEASVGDERTSVQVAVRETTSGVFGKMMSWPSMELTAKAKARLLGTRKLCLLTTDVGKDKVLNLDKNSSMTAPGCGVYSNSRNKKGMSIEENARLTASQICSSGGVEQKAGAVVTPSASPDCPQVPDPLATIPRPPAGACAETNLKISGIRSLSPGTYCGGIEISGTADVTLLPGVFVLDDGPLIVSGTARLTGRDVGIFFTGSKGGMRLDPGTSISLSAPKSGVMAGILFFEDRSVTAPVPPPPGPKGEVPPPPYGSQPMRQYRITSNNAPLLLGTIYLPAGRLIIDASTPVAQRSAYTVIVTRQLELNSGPDLYLNSDYEGSDVPVPQGVGSRSGAVALAK